MLHEDIRNMNIDKISNIGIAAFRYVQNLTILSLKFLFDIIYKIADLLVSINKIAFFLRSKFPSLWHRILHIKWVKRAISRAAIKKFGDITPARPKPLTMAAEYSTWYGFVDRKYTGRHLQSRILRSRDHQPSVSDLIDISIRKESQQNCIRSSYMFAAFAQWFTDSFLRTSHAFDFDSNGNVKIDPYTKLPIRLPGREKLNTSNHEIDLCQIYGLSEDKTTLLRNKNGLSDDRGCLAYQLIEGEEYPPFLLKKAPCDETEELSINDSFCRLHPDERIIRFIFRSSYDKNDTSRYETIFASGLEHGNSTIGNSLLNVIFFRAHNCVARLIGKENSEWDDERVFQTSRNVMIVLLLNIVISDYIRHISPLNPPFEYQPGLADKQQWYRTNRISIEFNLLYRWHQLVPDKFSFMNDLRNFRHNNKWIIDKGLREVIQLFSSEPACKIQLGNTPVFLKDTESDTISLMRASNLASYNDYRIHFGLSRVKSFGEITDSPIVTKQLRSLYRDVDSVEWYIGLFAEKHGTDAIMGDLMLNMVAHDAFTQALTNPLLAKNVFKEETFSKLGWELVNDIKTLNDLLKNLVYTDRKIQCSFGINSANS